MGLAGLPAGPARLPLGGLESGSLAVLEGAVKKLGISK
jgi:hypothetical protein